MYISKSEGAYFWLGELTDLQNRGLQDILIACVDVRKTHTFEHLVFDRAVDSFPSMRFRAIRKAWSG